MAKWINDLAADAALNLIKNNCVTLRAHSAQPAADPTAYALATKAGLISTDYTGPADGDASGRKLTVNAQAGVAIAASGNATHVSLYESSEDRTDYITTCATLALTIGGTVNFPAWKIEIADPI